MGSTRDRGRTLVTTSDSGEGRALLAAVGVVLLTAVGCWTLFALQPEGASKQETEPPLVTIDGAPCRELRERAPGGQDRRTRPAEIVTESRNGSAGATKR